MYRLNKTSQIVSVSPDMLLQEYEYQLNQEGLTGGYLPYQGYQVSLAECLYHRYPNLFGMKYGGIEEICSAGVAFNLQGELYKMNQAPRAATGSDLCRLVVGGEGAFGTFKEVTLRIFPVSEHEIWGFCRIDEISKIKEYFSKLWGLFIRPVFCYFGNDSEVLAEKIISARIDKVNSIWAIKLSGLKKMIETEKKVISELFKDELEFFWVRSLFELKTIDNLLIKSQNHQKFIDEVSPLLGGTTEINLKEIDKKLITYLQKS